MHAMVRQVFCRLENLNPTQEENKMSPLDGALSKAEMKMAVQAAPTPNLSSSADSTLSDDPLQGVSPGNRDEHIRINQEMGLAVQDCTYYLIRSQSVPKAHGRSCTAIWFAVHNGTAACVSKLIKPYGSATHRLYTHNITSHP